jgi:hypothetical protein
MRIDGEWYPCDDGLVRPVIRGEALAADGSWIQTLFLVDTGADRTVFSAPILEMLGLEVVGARERLGGIGGVVDSVIVESQIRLTYDGARSALFRGRYAALRQVEALDMSVLGRDILGLFAVVVDLPGDAICLLGQQHRYTVEGGG